MTSYRFSFLGPPVLSGPDGTIPLSGSKPQALLWYLAAQPDRVFARAHLAALLWEEADEAGGRNSLSTTLARLRHAMPVWPLQTTPETVTWDARAGVVTDGTAFQECANRGQRAEAVALWRGTFLEGFEVPASEGYEEWLRQERRTWEGRMLDLLGVLTGEAESSGDWSAMAGHARRALAIDPLQERFHRMLMAAYFRLGDRAAALAQYATCRRLLADELGIDPDSSTTALRDAMLEGTLPPVNSTPSMPAPTATRAAPMTAPHPPLVGRAQQLGQLQRVLTSAIAGRGRVVVLQGAAGIGKSRLMEELLWLIRQGEGGPACRTAMLGRCHEFAHGLPYAPFVEALGGVLASVDLAKLPLADIWLAEVNRLLPDLALMRSGLPVPQALEPGQQQRRLFEGVARFLAALPRPLLLVLEDLHWADEATQFLLAYLARQPILQDAAILVTIRTGDLSDDVSRLLEELRREGRLAWLEVDPLGADGIQSLVTALTGTANPVLGDRLFTETRGNPLFAVELVRELQESAAPEGLSPDTLRELPLPRTVQGLIQGRIGRLPQGARDLVTAASIFHRPVETSVLHQVAGLGEEQFLAALDSSVQTGVLIEMESGGVSFAHNLIRRTVQGRVGQARRQYLHRRAFQALHASGSPRLAEELAYHAMGAALWPEGHVWCLEAAAGALRVFAYPAATRYFEQGLSCLSNLPQEDAVRRQAIDLRLQIGQVSLYFQPGRLEEWLTPAVQEAQALGDHARLARVRLAQAGARYIHGSLGAALGALDEVLPLARASGSDAMLAPCLSLLGEVLAARGDYARAVPLLEEAVALQERLGGHLEAIVVRNMLAGVKAYLGDFAAAELMLEEQLQRSRASGDAAALASTLGFVATVAQMKGDWATAVQYGRDAIRRAEEAENLVHQYVPRVFLGLALAQRGDLGAGLEVQRQAVELARRLGTRLLLGQALGWSAAILLMAGHPDEAASVARDGLAVAEAEGALFDGALCTRVLGEIAATGDDGVRASQLLSDALERFSGIGHRPEMARCHDLLARFAPGAAEQAAHRQMAAQLRDAMGIHSAVGPE